MGSLISLHNWLTYTDDRLEKEITAIIEFMQSRGYFVYADTYVNSIFVRSAVWRARHTG